MENRFFKEAKRWLIQAKDEFLDADELRKRGRFYLALFHFQQAAEKALKAYLYYKTESPQVFFTHSIGELVEMANKFDRDFSKLKDGEKLDRYYIPTRYPNGIPGSIPSRYYKDPKEAKEAMEIAKKIIDFVDERMK